MIKQKNNIKSHQAVVPQGIRVVASEDLSIAGKKREVSSQGFATWIRVLLQNWRQGTVAVKGRSDVARSNKKPWKQKGTGRARAGSARSPLWRGGGVVFGPQRRSKTLSMPKKARRAIMNSLLFDFIEQGRIMCLSWSLSGDRPQTSQAFKALKEANLHLSKIVLVLDFNDVLTYASFANIPNVKIVFFDQINAYDLANANNWVYLEKDGKLFQEMVGQWI